MTNDVRGVVAILERKCLYRWASLEPGQNILAGKTGEV